MQKPRDSFVFYRSFFQAIDELPEQNQLEIYKAIFKYSLDFQDVKLEGISNAIFTLIKPQLEANNKRFINGCKGADSGNKGGRPKPQKNPKRTPKEPQKNPKGTPNVNVNDNVNDNVIIKRNNKRKIILPDFINPELFQDFVDMRKKKNPLTEKAIDLTLAKLSSFEDKKAGNANKALELSIERGYSGVFEPKDDFREKSSISSLHEKLKENW